ncbi:hypothetical protein H5410_062107 [Solanum commersonii]|uniref:RING-type E3 ubiquitin transferase n=1 Tax=Solanum commersonii TaxID=4109 RepID=A0A9J5W9T4_SOLCO|nr:hypothetical protein H5410_062107 [Solanum commersonii]
MASFTIREDQSKLSELGLTVYNRHFSFSRQITISLMSPFFCTSAQSIIMPGRSFTIPRNQARINMPRNQARNKEPRSKNQQKPISETCPKNSTISSTHESPTTPIAKKKKNFTPFRATSRVSVPAPIADWQSKKKKQKLRIKTLKFVDGDSTFSTHNSCCRKGRKTRYSCMAASFDDFVVSRKPHSAKGRVDIGKITPVEFFMQLVYLIFDVGRIGGTGDGIGSVSTGLKDDEITQCVRRNKPFSLNILPHLRTEVEKKCSICQEEMGKLGCGHLYHIDCITQWLMHKNSCPVCKSAAMSILMNLLILCSFCAS